MGDNRPDLDRVFELLEQAPIYALDLECEAPSKTKSDNTNPRKAKIIGFALAIDIPDPEAWYLDLKHDFSYPDIRRRIAPILEDPEKYVVMHFGKFDESFLIINGLNIRNKLVDTLGAAWITDETRRSYGLKDLSENLLGYKMEKYNNAQIGYLSSQFGKSMAEYAKDDARQTLALWRHLESPIMDQDLSFPFHTLEMPLVRVLRDMELKGIKIDPEKISALKEDFLKPRQEAAQKIFEMCGREFLLSSPEQVSHILFEDPTGPKLPIKQGLPKTEKGWSTGREMFLMYEDEFEIVRLLGEWRKFDKLLTTYVLPYINIANESDDCRVHARFNQWPNDFGAGTVTGRLSCSNPNLQNIPMRTDEGRRIRECFVPEDGYKFVVCDFSQIELRVAGHFCLEELGESAFAQAYIDGRDLHQQTADQIGCTRREGKIVNFGFLYGRGAKAFAATEKISLARAKKFRGGFHKTYPEIYKIHAITAERLTKYGYVKLLSGRRRRFPDCIDQKKDDIYWKSFVAWNSQVQGSSGDLMKISMRNMYNTFKSNPRYSDVYLVSQIHDEVIVECPENLAEEVRQIVSHTMENCYPGLRVPIIAEAAIGNSWLEAK